MKFAILLFISFTFLLFSCSTSELKTASSEQTDKTLSVVKSNDYELHKVPDEKAVLILFPGGGTSSKETKQEFDILKKAEESNISVMLMNFTNHLWIDELDEKTLTDELEMAFSQNDLSSSNIIIGGMSVGGTVALSLSHHLIDSSSKLKPKGVFMVDSPVDLHALYNNAQKDLRTEGFSEQRLAEPKFIVNYIEKSFGSHDSLVDSILGVSPFVHEFHRNNVKGLKDVKMRFYTEPDSIWWKENRSTDFKNTNAFAIRQISAQLERSGWKEFELIETMGKGYRADGKRHPHSWSVVDVDDLIEWILN